MLFGFRDVMHDACFPCMHYREYCTCLQSIHSLYDSCYHCSWLCFVSVDSLWVSFVDAFPPVNFAHDKQKVVFLNRRTAPETV